MYRSKSYITIDRWYRIRKHRNNSTRGAGDYLDLIADRGDFFMAQRLYKLRSAYLEDIHAGKPITKEEARTVFNQQKSDLLFQDVEQSTVRIPSECIAILQASALRQSLPTVNTIREFNRLPPATTPTTEIRNRKRHHWVPKLGGSCDSPGCPALGFQYCQNCRRRVCNIHKRKTECS